MGNNNKGIARVAATAVLALGLSSVALPAHAASIYDDPNYQAMVNALSTTEQAIMGSQTVSLAITQSAGTAADALSFMSSEDVVLTPTVSTLQLSEQVSQDSGASWMPQGSSIDETISNGVAYSRFDPMASVCLNFTLCLTGSAIQKIQKSKSTWISAPVTDLPGEGTTYVGMMNPTPALGLGLMGINSTLGQIPQDATVTVDDSNQLLTQYNVASSDGSFAVNVPVEKSTGYVLGVNVTQNAQSQYAEVKLDVRAIGGDLAAPNFTAPVDAIDASHLLKSVSSLRKASTNSLLKFAGKVISLANSIAKKAKHPVSLSDAYKAAKKLASKSEKVTNGKASVTISRNQLVPSCATIMVIVKTRKLQAFNCY